MAENGGKFQWTKLSTKAAQLFAGGKLSGREIAEQIGAGERTVERWKAHPEFIARVEGIVEAERQAILTKGIADKVRRVEALNDRHERMTRVIEARATAMPDDAPGSDTGLLVHQVKMIGQGPKAMRIDEYAVDTGLLKELREHEKQAAQEVGDWAEKHQVEVEFTGARDKLTSGIVRLAARVREDTEVGGPHG